MTHCTDATAEKQPSLFSTGPTPSAREIRRARRSAARSRPARPGEEAPWPAACSRCRYDGGGAGGGGSAGGRGGSARRTRTRACSGPRRA